MMKVHKRHAPQRKQMPQPDTSGKQAEPAACGHGPGHHHHSKQEEVEHGVRTTILSLDNLGIAASTLCMIHCLAMPFLIGVLPLLGLQFLEGHTAHMMLAAFVFTFALTAVIPGYLKHRNTLVLSFMFLGLSMVMFATFCAGPMLGDKWELPLITVGNLMLVGTHIRNGMLSRCTTHEN